jgi:hypothetical protein
MSGAGISNRESPEEEAKERPATRKVAGAFGKESAGPSERDS